MEVKQIFTLMNTVTGEVLGKRDLVAEDLSNVVDVGTEIFASEILRTIDSPIEDTHHSEFPDAKYSEGSGVRAVNLLKLYNDKFSATLTPVQAVANPEFIRFSAYIMGLYQVINDIVSGITYKISPVENY